MGVGELGSRPRPSPAAVMRVFGLGSEVVSMRVVAGAWSNRVFRLATDTGEYAVKQMLDPWRDPRWRDWLDEAWRFEQVAYAAGVPMPQPVSNPLDGSWLGWVEPALRTSARDRREPVRSEQLVPVRVHHWVAGRRPAPGPVSESVARWTGRVLATLHDLRVPPSDRTLFPGQDTVTADRWPELVELSERLGASWSARLAEVSGTVAVMADLARTTRSRPDEEVMSHADLDQKNVIVAGGGPVLCDWDVCAPQVPVRELVDVAFSMADWRRFDIARAVVTSYRAAGGTEAAIEPADLGPQLMADLDWIAFNVERALGIRPATAQEVALGNHLVPDLVTRLPERLAVAGRLPGLLEG
jgi:Ser/Thr protein kinase RdoA (MazF antagonist)